METAVTYTPGSYVPSLGGIGGVVWQAEVSRIMVNGVVKFTIIDGTSWMNTSDGQYDVSEDVPAGLDHEAVVAFWLAKLEAWEAETHGDDTIKRTSWLDTPLLARFRGTRREVA